MNEDHSHLQKTEFGQKIFQKITDIFRFFIHGAKPFRRTASANEDYD
jgi:hypothetical protein